jgi:uncharacterized protein DUF4760
LNSGITHAPEFASTREPFVVHLSLEAWSTAASIGTFVVIAATAAAALVQLRHMRSSNQIAAVNQLQQTLESERFTRQRRFVADQVPKLIADPVGRSKLGTDPFPDEMEAVRDVGNFFEVVGVFVKLGIIDRALFCDLWDNVAFKTWKQMEPAVMIRRTVSYPGIWTNFEYLAVICEESLSKRPGGKYPRGMRRMTIDERSSAAAAALVQDRSSGREV